MTTGAKIAVIGGSVVLVTVLIVVLTKKKKPALSDTGSMVGYTATPGIVPDERKQKDNSLAIAGIGAAAAIITGLLAKGKKNKKETSSSTSFNTSVDDDY